MFQNWYKTCLIFFSDTIISLTKEDTYVLHQFWNTGSHMANYDSIAHVESPDLQTILFYNFQSAFSRVIKENIFLTKNIL